LSRGSNALEASDPVNELDAAAALGFVAMLLVHVVDGVVTVDTVDTEDGLVAAVEIVDTVETVETVGMTDVVSNI
jgi:hypothetical protein